MLEPHVNKYAGIQAATLLNLICVGLVGVLFGVAGWGGGYN